MLLGTLGESLLGNKLSGNGINRTDEGIIRNGYGHKKSLIKVFWYRLLLQLILKCKSIIRINLDLIEFILAVI